jgi:hypothetical protein
MTKYIATYQRLVVAGYRKDKAMLAVVSAFGLSPEQIAQFAKAVA